MSVTLNPSDTLGFERPLTRLVPQVLSVTNPHSEPVLFKIKTTAPKSYSVRPNAARIDPGQTVEVHIVLQPLPEEPPVGGKNRDKFLVQSAMLTPERETLELHSVWSVVPAEEISEQKVRVAWLGPNEAHASAAGVGTRAGDSLAPPAAAAVPTSVTDTSADQTLASVAPPGYTADDATRASPLVEKPLPTPGGGSDVEYQARISQLQRQLAAAQAEKGVPVQQVAIVAALVFFLTYLFF